MMKLYMRPNGSEIDPSTGIGRVCLAQLKYLPDYDIRVIDDWKDADVIAGHTHGHDLPASVVHCHGLYWSGDEKSGKYLGWHAAANQRIMESLRRAREITVPSNWVAMPFKRDMRISPTVIGHGIDISEWQPGKNGGYLLWNKNRSQDVCDPRPPHVLALRGLPVRSTFAPDNVEIPYNLSILGRLPFAEMKLQIAGADVYLATTKETFGIGTLEALACGVPVLGWNWGGTADIVTHKLNGWLCEPDDYDGLLEGYGWIRDHRKQLSEAARATAESYNWPAIIGKYAEVYRRVLSPEPDGVSIVIPCYNYAKFVGEAIESALRQKEKPAEIIVVNDGSTDGSLEIIRRYADKVRIIDQPNSGVAAARNNGIRAATQPFIVTLDADDVLEPDFVKVCHAEIKKDRQLGIVYTGLSLRQGDKVNQYQAWPPEFNWTGQTVPHIPPSNCIPSVNMFRKTMWERAGGIRQQYAPNEDCEFWTRGLSVGFTAKKVTSQNLYQYRISENSASRSRKPVSIADWKPWMYDKEYPMGAPSSEPPLVRSYSQPLASVIIPVAPAHIKYLPVAIESLLGQTCRDWEAIAVLDSCIDADEAAFLAVLKPYPFVRQLTTTGKLGAGEARNTGLASAVAPMVLWLDADDYIMPTALDKMLDKWQRSGGRWVYTDWQTHTGEKHAAPEYDPMLYQKTLFNGVTALMTREQAQAVGGFDMTLDAWEDWDFFIRLAIAGYHGIRLEGHHLVYRTDSGIRRKIAKSKADALRATILGRYTDIFEEGIKIMARCCGGSRAAQTILDAKRAIGQAAPQSPELASMPDSVRMEYYGPRAGAVTYVGKSGRRYSFGNSTTSRYNDVVKEDVALFLSMEFFRIIKKEEPKPIEAPMQAVDPVTERSPEPAAPMIAESAPVAVDPEPVKPAPVAKKRTYTKKAVK